tara:strand:+ start:481 stop:717 length:237 start_codon:yes stop_codon:yes gene_type:complete
MDNDCFTFSYDNGVKRVTVSFDALTWPEALEEFTSFISASFGYSIKDDVAIKTSNFRLTGDWSGPVFDGDEWKEKEEE